MAPRTRTEAAGCVVTEDSIRQYDLGWLVDQLRVKTNRRSGIVHDPNEAFARDEIVGLVRQVSVETVRVMEVLTGLGLPEG